MSDGDISINLRLDDKDFAVTVRNAGRLLSELKRNLDTTASGAKAVENHFSSFTTQLRHTVMTLASVRFAMMDINDVFLQLPKSILKTTGEMERLTKLMEGLSKQSDQGARVAESMANTEYILGLAKRAPFEIKALSDAFVKLKSGGIDPTNGSMQALVDSVSRFGGDSQTLHRASIAIQQMAGKGVISMEELRQQLGEAVPNAMQLMATGMGMSVAELTKQVSKGIVQSGDALARMFTVMEFANRGAAAEMMTTWSGMTSRVQTEWAILQTTVGKSGFMDEVKKQVNDLLKIMTSNEAKNFAIDMGQGLAEAVRMMRGFADGMQENWKWIKLAGEAMLTYFGISKIQSILGGLAAMTRGVASAGTAAANKYRLETEMKQGAIAAEAAMDAAALEKQLAQDSAYLLKREAYYRGLLTRHANYLAQIRQLEAANDVIAMRYERRGLDPSTSGTYQQNQKDIEAMNRKVQATDALIQKEREAQRAISAGTVVLAQTTADKLKVADAAGKAANGIGLMSKAMTGATWVMGALGGPIGIISTALMVGIPLWLEWGNKGEEAINKVKEAINRGTADKSTVDALEQQIKDQKAALEKHRNEKIDYSMFPNAAAIKQARDAAEAHMVKELADMNDNLGKARKQRTANEAREYAQEQRKLLDEKLAGIASGYREEEAKHETESNAKLAKLKQGSDAEKKLQKEVSKERIDIINKEAKARYEAIATAQAQAQKEYNDAAKGGDTGQKAKTKAFLDEMNEQLAAVSKYKASVEHLYDKPVLNANKKAEKIDPLNAELALKQSELVAAQIKLDDLSDGIISFNRIKDAALAKLKGEVAAGRFNFKDSEGNPVKASEKDARLEQIASIEASIEVAKREAAARTSLAKLGREVALARQEASDRSGNDGYEKETTGLIKLKKELANIKATLPETSEEFKKFEENTRNLISDQAIADLQNFTADLKKASRDIQASLEPTERGRNEAAYQAEISQMKAKFEVRRKAILDDAIMSSEERSAAVKRAEEQLGDWLVLKQQEHVRKMRTPLQQLAEEWKDVAKQMETASARWADQTIDLLMELTTTGKANFKDFAVSILKDIARIQMKESLGGAITGVIGKASGWITNMITGNIGQPQAQQGSAGQAAGQAAGAALPGVFDKLIAGGKSLWASLTGASDAANSQAASAGNVIAQTATQLIQGTTKMTSEQAQVFAINNVTTAAMEAAAALNYLAAAAGSSGGGGGGGILGSLVSAGIGYFTGGWGSAGGDISAGNYDTLMNMDTSGYSSEVPTDLGGTEFFANGGIMTEFGSVSLKKYAKGGVANSPQLALFGEGSMNEAYVPLPDGRSIPVTLSGGAGMGAGGSNVVINIMVTNNNGSTKEDKSEGSGEGSERDFYKTMATQIKGIVVEQMVVQQRPGGVLYRG